MKHKGNKSITQLPITPNKIISRLLSSDEDPDRPNASSPNVKISAFNTSTPFNNLKNPEQIQKFEKSIKMDESSNLRSELRDKHNFKEDEQEQVIKISKMGLRMNPDI